jgi:FkbM family methyltransferase
MALRRLLRLGLERLLAARGYELRLSGTPPKGYARFLADARHSGVQPATVFDIGVGDGTPWLYEAFPNAKFVLIEPQQTFRVSIEQLRATLDADWHQCALGSEARRERIFIPQLVPTSASLKPWTPLTEILMKGRGQPMDGCREEVEVRTLDGINSYKPPFFLKIDTEGSELDILRGSVATLRNTLMVLAEASVLARHEGGARLSDLIGFMAEQGFELFDLPAMEQDRPGGRLLYVDAAFARTDLQ